MEWLISEIESADSGAMLRAVRTISLPVSSSRSTRKPRSASTACSAISITRSSRRSMSVIEFSTCEISNSAWICSCGSMFSLDNCGVRMVGVVLSYMRLLIPALQG